jgi:hypothetical protein
MKFLASIGTRMNKRTLLACLMKFLASIGTRMDKRTLLACCWTKFLASIGTGMNRTLVGMLDEVSWHPLEPGWTQLCRLILFHLWCVRSRAREREREGRSLRCVCGWDCLFCLWGISRIQSAG